MKNTHLSAAIVYSDIINSMVLNDLYEKWITYSIKKQLLLIFSTITLIFLGLISIMAIMYVAMTVVRIKVLLYDNLLSQSIDNLKQISYMSAINFDKKLLGYSRNFLNVLAYSSNDCFRKDYPFEFIPSYYNWPGQLINPIYSDLFSASITYDSSTYNVYNKTIYDMPYINKTISELINVTASLDNIFKPSYKINNDFLAGYISTKTQFLRYYPGTVNETNLNRFINYSPFNDAWFNDAINMKDDATLFGSPYYDPIAKQFMITISKKIYNNTEAIGVAGGDLILNTLQTDIKKITYMKNGRVILFELESGIIIVDSNYTYPKISTYKNIYGFQIDDIMWKNILNNQKNILTTPNHYIASNALPNTGNKYIIVSIALKSDIYDVFQPTINNIDIMLSIDIVVICVLSPVIIGVIIFFVILLTYSIASPIQKLIDNTSQMINNIGSNITENIVPIVDSFVSETCELQMNYKKIHEIIKLQESKPIIENIANDLYNQNNPWSLATAPILETDAIRFNI